MKEKLINYFKGDELAANVWLSKYAQEGEETPDDMHKRMAKEFARIEKEYVEREDMKKLGSLSSYGVRRKRITTSDEIYELFKDFKYIIPQGSVMATLGTDKLSSLSNCFFNGHMEDNINSIWDITKSMAQIGKMRGGTSTDLSYLRPKGASVNNSAKTSGGAVDFLNLIDSTGKIIGQNGRKMAMMVTMDINHPDILDFINIKRDLSKVTNANLSVKLNDEFMKAVENDEDYVLRFPCDWKDDTRVEGGDIIKQYEYNKLYPVKEIGDTVGYVKKIRAKEYWDEIIKSAHSVAEPGLLMWDNILNYSPDSVYEQYKPYGTNPCSEITLSKLDSCRLMVVNLYSFIDNPFTKDAKFNYKKFYEINYEAMRLSDDLVDLEVEYVQRIIDKLEKETTDNSTEISMWKEVQRIGKSGRRTGLGFTALGDTLAALGLKYDSDEALEIIEQIMRTKMESELDCTTDLAILRGTFEGWDNTKEFGDFKEIKKAEIGETKMNVKYNNDVVYNFDLSKVGNNFYSFILLQFSKQAIRIAKFGRRNCSFSTVAPTGTVSLMAQTTSGIEPLFQPFYIRRKKVNPNDEDVRVDFTDQNGDTWQEFAVFHPKFVEWYIKEANSEHAPHIAIEALQRGSKEDLQKVFEQSPWYGSTANDIDWIKRVEIQSIIQKYITHSISSTINLPNDVSEEEVSKIYLESWRKGLKGITVNIYAALYSNI